MAEQNLLESAHQYILYDDVGGGISRATAPHKIDRSKWFDSLNMRFRSGRAEQIVPLAQLVRVSEDGNDTTSLLVMTPVTISATASTMVAVSQKFLYSINAITLDNTRVNSGAAFSLGNAWTRWEFFTHETGFYFCNPFNPVKKYTATGGVVDLITVGTVYRATYIENFYGHVVLGNVNDNSSFWPNRVVWSDKDDFSDFVPISTNEADLFDIEQVYGTSPNGIGITGLRKLGNELFIYTSNSIWGMAYVGLQAGVMQITSRVRDVGNYFPYGLASVRDTHFFIGQDDFYKFDGVSVEPIGMDVRDYFFADIHPLLQYQNLTHCEVNIELQEITWYYCSKANTVGTIDKAVVYNYAEKLFYPIDGRGVTCVVRAKIQTYKRIDDFLGTTINGLSGSIQALSNSNAFEVNLFGTYDTYVLREATLADPASAVIEESEPFLESGDIHRGTILGFKELESMGIDASYTHGTGVKVEVSQRDYLANPVVFAEVGNWLPTVQERRLSLPRSAGRVARYRFTATGAPPWYRTANNGMAVMFLIEEGINSFSAARTGPLNEAIRVINTVLNGSGASRLAAVGFYGIGSGVVYNQPLTTQVNSVATFLNAAKAREITDFGAPYGNHPFWAEPWANSPNMVDGIVPAIEQLKTTLAMSCGSRHLVILSDSIGYLSPVVYTVDAAKASLLSSSVSQLWQFTNSEVQVGDVANISTLGTLRHPIELTTWVEELLALRPQGFKFLGFEENVYKTLQER
jgi:hypothetical protein